MSMASLNLARERVLSLVAQAAGTSGTREPIAVRAPFTGEIFGQIPAADENDVEAAVARGRAAQAGWAALSIRERAAILLRFHDLLLARQSEALDIIQLET